ncbi:unnamed protein product [Brassicogethes aeneus]|uniref:BESS domain-containing protein n=1 Tax=Brassicogethes aeneus TaxID=1431903 RepID=A0A9P0B293_BRAAE|nr:unnamed protein product [Brassicogethes aeneus]
MDDGLLIEQVSGFPALFNKADKRYKSKLDKEAAWRTIGDILNEMRRTTSNYQKLPEQELRAQSPPSSPSVAWDSMYQITSDSASESNSMVQTPLFTSLDNETPSTSGKVPIPRRTMPKKRNAQEAMIEKMSSCFDHLNKRVQSAPPTPDEDLHFAKSLAHDMKILSPLQKIQFKKTIYELLENIASETL